MAVNEESRVKRTFSKRKQLEQDLAHVTQEMYKRNLELAETNRILSLLRSIDSLALESHDSLDDLSDKIAHSIVENSEYPLVALITKRDRGRTLTISGLAVNETLPIVKELPELRTLKLDMETSWFNSPERALLVQVEDLTSAIIGHRLAWSSIVTKKVRDKLPLKTVYLVKLTARQHLVGILVIGFTNRLEKLSNSEVVLLDRLSEALGLAIDSKLLFEENQHVLKQLQKTNEKLRALDETKDEFISMASHQLRTPLTSVKGYVSMVLEGDAGKLNKMQQKLLDQAFISSQRMVYLIADLLNVSRLRTGKFVIEAKPTNLADVVEGEIAQLVETAKSRDLELSFKKPKNFPTLMIDETKTRQVIMNFIDNAIYYTPAGGHITISLQSSATTVECSVVDDGIGVPKAEQHHLFTKFYRAGNARKARPDGTGLGLFMAKKVVVAQGGAIVFRSEEGTGSTFGFSFPRAKLETKEKVAVSDETISIK